MTIYFCWLCDRPLYPPLLSAAHYEIPARKVYFCSAEHEGVYLWLALL